MHFRSMKKSAQDVSLSDYLEDGGDGTPLSYMDVISDNADLLENLSTKESVAQLGKAMEKVLTEQERKIIRLRYGLDGNPPQRQREVAQITGISRSYVSRRH